MLVDARRKYSVKGHRVPCNYMAYLYRFSLLDGGEYHIILADSRLRADNFLKRWMIDNDMTEFFPQFLCELDFTIVQRVSDDDVLQTLFSNVFVSDTD